MRIKPSATYSLLAPSVALKAALNVTMRHYYWSTTTPFFTFHSAQSVTKVTSGLLLKNATEISSNSSGNKQTNAKIIISDNCDYMSEQSHVPKHSCLKTDFLRHNLRIYIYFD